MTINPAEKLILFPHHSLRQVAQEVDTTEDVNQLIVDMLLVLKTIRGGGLSAPQIGVNKRISICNLTSGQLVLINPKYITKELTPESLDMEGCLSLPGIYIRVPRYKEITVSFKDTNGQIQEQTFTDFNARVIQHELDHLDGHLIIDYISQLKRDIVTRKLKKLQKEINYQEKISPGAKSRTIKNVYRALESK